MYRNGHGWVSFYWGAIGNPDKDFAGGSGIAKIIAKRTSEGADGEDVARKMVDVIALGKAGPVTAPEAASGSMSHTPAYRRALSASLRERGNLATDWLG